MKALILAHKPVVLGRSRIPMALLPAFDRPLLARVVEDLWDRGARSAVVTVNERVPLVERWLETDQRFEFDLQCLPVAETDSVAEILPRIPGFEPAVIAQGACFGLEHGAHGSPRLVTHSLEDYRREMLRQVISPFRDTSLAGIAVGSSVVEAAADAPLARVNRRCFLGRGVVIGRRATVSDSVVLRGAALLGRCDLERCVVMPGAVVRDHFARDAIIGFEAWADRLAKEADRAARRRRSRERAGRWQWLRYRFGSGPRQARRAEQIADRCLSADCDPWLKQSVVDWVLGNPQEAFSHLLSFR